MFHKAFGVVRAGTVSPAAADAGLGPVHKSFNPSGLVGQADSIQGTFRHRTYPRWFALDGQARGLLCCNVIRWFRN
jgi:hypothetical protein